MTRKKNSNAGPEIIKLHICDTQEHTFTRVSSLKLSLLLLDHITVHRAMGFSVLMMEYLKPVEEALPDIGLFTVSMYILC